jgi:hypothetical protein
MSTADLTALDSQWKYALHYNCIGISDLRHLPELTSYRTQYQHANHYTIDEVGICVIMKQNERYAGHQRFW